MKTKTKPQTSFKDALKKAKGDQYYYDPKTKTHKVKKEYLDDVIDEIYDTIKQKIDDVTEEQKRGKNWSEQCAINAIAEKLKEELL